MPSLGEFRAEGFTCFIELRQHLLPLLDETGLGVEFALPDVGFALHQRVFAFGGVVISFVQSRASFRQLALPHVEFFTASGDRALLLTEFRDSGIQLLVAALTLLPCPVVHVARFPNHLPQSFDIDAFGFRFISDLRPLQTFLLRNGQRMFVFGSDRLFRL